MQTACYSWHVQHGGRMVDFAGWQMPVQYTSIISEHQAVRQAAGLFDIAHMGRIKFTGPDACRLLDALLTNDVTKLKPGEIRYSLITNEAGGILDDVLVYRFEEFYVLVVNASNRTKIVDWIAQHRAGHDVAVDDVTTATFMLAVQGPRALETLMPHVNADIGRLAYYHGSEVVVCGRPGIVSRTGYTGEDGFEVVVEASDGLDAWHALLATSREIGLVPCGLGARDTLRLEAAMPLYGHELTESIDPLTAGLGFGVKLGKRDFLGKSAPGCDQAIRRAEGADRIGARGQAHRPRRGRRFGRRPRGGPCHLRHLFADVRAADRHGLHRLRNRPAGAGVGSRYPRHARTSDARRAAVLSAAINRGASCQLANGRPRAGGGQIRQLITHWQAGSLPHGTAYSCDQLPSTSRHILVGFSSRSAAGRRWGRTLS